MDADNVLKTLDGFRKPISTAPGKLARIRSTLQGLRNHKIVIANDISVKLGELLDPGDEKYPSTVGTQRPTLLFGPQGRKTGLYPDLSVTTHGPYMYMQHERNSPLIAVVCESRHRGRVDQFMNLLRDGFPDSMWKNSRKKNPFSSGLIGKYRLSRIRIEYEECQDSTPQFYKNAINKLLGRLTDTPDLAIVQIRDSFHQLYGDANPYLVSKATFMMAVTSAQLLTHLPPEN